METIHQIYRKAIWDNEPYFRRGLLTARESDMIARRNTVRYLTARSRTLNSLVEMVI